MNDQERLEKGKLMFKKVYGDVLSIPENPTGFSDMTLRTLFSEIFTRDGMSLRDRRLVILGVIAGQGADPSLFEIHARAALGNGELTHDELEEVCFTLVPYCGYPKASPILVRCQKLRAELEKSQ